jgi:multiple sugar transport system substrate-binding protein
VTPAYPVITSAFQEAMAGVIGGGDVKVALEAAVKTIDQDIRENGGYATK